MLQTKPTPRRALPGYALALPLMLGLLMCTQQNRDKATDPVSERQQIMAPESLPSGEVYNLVEEQPAFPGGTDKLIAYLGQHIKYPAAAQRANVHGRVFIQFVVTDQGQITRVRVLKGIGFGCDEEAAHVVREMPRWIPGKQSGKPVNVQFNLPIAFALENEKTSSTRANKLPETYAHFVIDGRSASGAELMRFMDKYPRHKKFVVLKYPATKTLEIKTI